MASHETLPKLPLQLHVYFEDTPIDVLKSFTNEELLQAVDKQDRVALLAFLKKGGFKDYTSPKWSAFDDKLLDLNARATSDVFADISNMNLSKVLESLADIDTTTKTIIDLRANNLLESDLPTIAGFVKRFPTIRYLLLQKNRMGATNIAWEKLVQLLKEQPHLCIAISGNPIASVDGAKVLFDKLDRLTGP